MKIDWTKNNQVVVFKDGSGFLRKYKDNAEIVEIKVEGPGENETLFKGTVIYSQNSHYEPGDESNTWVKLHFKPKNK